jgi:hypothetical protein
VGKNDDKNAEVVGDLKRRLTMAYVILFSSIAMIPLGFICPCGISIALADASMGAAAGFGIASLLLPFVGLGGLLLMTGDRSKYVRGLAVAEVAESRRFRYAYEPKKKQYQFLRSFRLLDDPDDEFASHLMTGKIDKIPVTALDYSHAYGLGTAAIVYRATVVVFMGGFEQTPSFVLYPKGWLDKLRDLISGRPLKFSTSKAFNETFAIVGDEPSRIEAIFDERLVKLCLKEDNLMLEVRQGRLLAYCYETILTPDAYETFLDLVADIAAVLRDQAADDDDDAE